MTENNTTYVGLTCKECGQPIDMKTAIHTPTGYMCKNCKNQRKQAFNNSKTTDLIVGPIIALILSAISAGLINLLTSMLGFYGLIAIFFGAPFIAKIIANIVRSTTGKRRSNNLFLFSTIAVAIGAILPVSSIIIAIFTGGLESFGLIMLAIAPIFYAIMLTGSYYFHLSGRRINL